MRTHPNNFITYHQYLTLNAQHASLANHQHLTPNTQHPPLAVTFCDLCMPKAFCEIETVRKNVLLNLWVLWEKKSPASLKNILFLTEEHRWTEHTGFHRDIKSTDITEPYSHRSLTPLPHSIQEHALLHSRTCPSTSKNTPFLMLDKALLQRCLQPLDFMWVTETDRTYILNGKLMLIDRMTERHRMTE